LIMKTTKFVSGRGVTGRVYITNENTVIIKHRGMSSEAIEIELDTGLIRIYDSKQSWTVLPMDKDQRP